MPKFEIYGEAKSKKEEPLRLRLIEHGGVIVLATVDVGGDVKYCGNLLRFETDGTVSAIAGVNPSLGLKLTGLGTLAIE